VQAVTGPCDPLEAVFGAESLRRWRHYLPAIKEESGIDPLDHVVRYLYAALEEQDVAELWTLTSELQAQGLNTEWIDAPAALALEPRLNPGILGGMLHQDVIQMDAQRCVNALETIVRARGGMFIEGEVTGLRQDGDRVRGVTLRDGSAVACETLVLALGGWTGIALSRWLGVSLPIQPYSLQKLHVQPIGAPLGCAVRWQGINIVTRRDGNVHVGSKHEDTGLPVWLPLSLTQSVHPSWAGFPAWTISMSPSRAPTGFCSLASWLRLWQITSSAVEKIPSCITCVRIAP
jgi:glycine/D-amino acid oxidase-like deaminating enzyme